MIDALEIPKHWLWLRFSDVATVVSQVADPTLTPDAFHIAPNHIEPWTGRLLPFSTVGLDGVTSPKHLFHAGQILYSKIRPYLAKVTIPHIDGLCSADMYPIQTSLEPRYLLYWMLSPWFTNAAVQHQGRTVLPKINRRALYRLPVPVPPLVEQARIAKRIDELLSGIANALTALERASHNLVQLRDALLASATTGTLSEEWRSHNSPAQSGHALVDDVLALRQTKWQKAYIDLFSASNKRSARNWQSRYSVPQQPNAADLPSVPQSWCWTTLESIADTTGGITVNRQRRSQAPVRAVPYLRVANVQRGFLDLTDVKLIRASAKDIATFRLKPGDVLFTEGGDRDKLGRGWIWGGELPECIHQNHVFRARLHSPAIQPKFVSLHGNTFGREWFANAGKQTTNLASINLRTIRSFPIPIPPPDEQQYIVEQVDTRLTALTQQEKVVSAALKRSAVLRQSILRAAFEGRLAVQEVVQGGPVDRQAYLRPGTATPLAIPRHPHRNSIDGKSKMKSPPTRGLLDVLDAHPKGMTPEALLTAAGYDLDSIDAFYSELRRVKSKIEEIRPDGAKRLRWPITTKILLRIKSR